MDQDGRHAPRRAPPRPRAARLAQRMSRLLAQALAEAFAPLDLAPAPFMVLRELWKADGLTQTQLARALEVEQATIAKTLKRMARDGLILREPHPGDSRSSMIRLTERARRLETSAKVAAKGVDARAFGGLTRKEHKRFVDMTTRVIAALKDDAAGASPFGPTALPGSTESFASAQNDLGLVRE